MEFVACGIKEGVVQYNCIYLLLSIIVGSVAFLTSCDAQQCCPGRQLARFLDAVTEQVLQLQEVSTKTLVNALIILL